MPLFTSSGRNAASVCRGRVSGGAYSKYGFHVPSRRRYTLGAAQSHAGASGLPQQLDLLERYRGLVALGRVTYDEEQVRVIAQVRPPHA